MILIRISMVENIHHRDHLRRKQYIRLNIKNKADENENTIKNRGSDKRSMSLFPDLHTEDLIMSWDMTFIIMANKERNEAKTNRTKKMVLEFYAFISDERSLKRKNLQHAFCNMTSNLYSWEHLGRQIHYSYRLQAKLVTHQMLHCKANSRDQMKRR